MNGISKDQLVFIDSSSVDHEKKLKIPKQVTEEEAAIFIASKEALNAGLQGALFSNAFISYISGSAFQFLWGLINSIQMTVLTSLFGI